METYTLKLREKTFDAAQYLPEEFGKCHNLHGPTYTFRNIYVETDRIVDFALIKQGIDYFDHCIIAPEKDKDFWDSMNTVRDAPVIFKVKYIPYEMATVEYMALHLRKMFMEIPGVTNVFFELYETPNQGTVI